MRRKYHVEYFKVTRFLEGENGVRGTLWPSSQEICVKADERAGQTGKEKRWSFHDLRRGSEGGKRLEPGGFLRLRIAEDAAGGYSCDRPTVLSYSEDESEKRMRFGMGYLQMYTPKKIQQKKYWLMYTRSGQALVDAEEARLGGKDRNEICEMLLQKSMKGEFRYAPYVNLFTPEKIFEESGRNRVALKEYLTEFFSDPLFTPREGKLGVFRPIKPHLILRSLDLSGDICAYSEFQPCHAEVISGQGEARTCTFLSAEECVDNVMSSLEGCEYCSILPGYVYRYARAQLRMGAEGSEDEIRHVAKIHQAGQQPDMYGINHPIVRPMGIRLSQENSFVALEALYKEDLAGVSPIRLRGDGSLYSLAADQEEIEQEERAAEELNPRLKL